jgi:hypothetical protein
VDFPPEAQGFVSSTQATDAMAHCQTQFHCIPPGTRTVIVVGPVDRLRPPAVTLLVIKAAASMIMVVLDLSSHSTNIPQVGLRSWDSRRRH